MLPRSQTEPYYESIGEFRPNKGTILKASVNYIRLLKSESEKWRAVEAKQQKLEQQNRRLLLKIQAR